MPFKRDNITSQKSLIQFLYVGYSMRLFNVFYTSNKFKIRENKFEKIRRVLECMIRVITN